MWRSRGNDGCRDERARAQQQETYLDLDRALRRMKAELAITELHRRLLDPSLDGRAVLEITDRIQALQRQR